MSGLEKNAKNKSPWLFELIHIICSEGVGQAKRDVIKWAAFSKWDKMGRW